MCHHLVQRWPSVFVPAQYWRIPLMVRIMPNPTWWPSGMGHPSLLTYRHNFVTFCRIAVLYHRIGHGASGHLPVVRGGRKWSCGLASDQADRRSRTTTWGAPPVWPKLANQLSASGGPQLRDGPRSGARACWVTPIHGYPVAPTPEAQQASSPTRRDTRSGTAPVVHNDDVRRAVGVLLGPVGHGQ